MKTWYALVCACGLLPYFVLTYLHTNHEPLRLVEEAKDSAFWIAFVHIHFFATKSIFFVATMVFPQVILIMHQRMRELEKEIGTLRSATKGDSACM